MYLMFLPILLYFWIWNWGVFSSLLLQDLIYTCNELISGHSIQTPLPSTSPSSPVFIPDSTTSPSPPKEIKSIKTSSPHASLSVISYSRLLLKKINAKISITEEKRLKSQSYRLQWQCKAVVAITTLKKRANTSSNPNRTKNSALNAVWHSTTATTWLLSPTKVNYSSLRIPQKANPRQLQTVTHAYQVANRQQ